MAEGPFLNKAGERNRTAIYSLGSCHSAIELHPHSFQIQLGPALLYKSAGLNSASGLTFTVVP